MTRKGFQIAASTIVVLILGLIIVGGGTLLVAKIQAGSQDIISELTALQERRLQNLLRDGRLIATFPASGHVRPGEDIVYGVAVSNKLDTSQTFSLEFTVLNESQDSVYTAVDTNNWVFVYTDTFSLDRNEEMILRVALRPPEDVPAGEYTVIVAIKMEDGSVYDSPQFFTVRVQ